MTDTLPGLEDQTPPAGPFIAELLEGALIANDGMKLPALELIQACTTNAEIDALYLPFFNDMHALFYNATLAHVLIRLEANHPNLAAGLAAEVRSYLDDGGLYGELVWDWAEKRGLDPEKIIADARTAAEERLNTVPRHLQTAVPLDGTEASS